VSADAVGAQAADAGSPRPARPQRLRPDITPNDARTVRRILDTVIPGHEVWVFGSRATGRARPFSDLDLLITRPPSLSWAQRAALREAFEDSALTFRVDIVVSDDLAGGFADRVLAERVTLPQS
jgi:uncharacterized protein